MCGNSNFQFMIILKDIQCLSTLGLAVHPQTLHRKLATWESSFSEDLLQIKTA